MARARLFHVLILARIDHGIEGVPRLSNHREDPRREYRECNSKQIEVDAVGRRKWGAAFDAEHIFSDGGLALLHRTDRLFGLMKKFAACFRDLRAPELIHHPVEELVRHRVLGIACGYEELVDYATLRDAPLLAAVVGKADPSERLASPSTLNRLALTPADATPAALSEGLPALCEGGFVERA